MDRINIGKRLRDRRLREGLLGKELAAILGVTDRAIFHHEVGRRLPDDDLKIKYAKHYGCTVEELFFAGQY